MTLPPFVFFLKHNWIYIPSSCWLPIS